MVSKKIVKHINKLQQKKYRRENKEFVVDGLKGVSEALSSDLEVLMLLVEGSRRDEENFAELIRKAEEQSVVVEFISRKEIGDIKSTDTFPGIMAVVTQQDISLEGLLNNSAVICLDGVKDPGNLGTIIRTADWFGIKNILLSEDCVDPYNPKVVRSTMGSIMHLNIFESLDLLKTLEKLRVDYKIFGLTMNGQQIDSIKSEKKAVYIFGSESHGVRKEVEDMFDAEYTILGKGRAESLNVAVAAAILMSKL